MFLLVFATVVLAIGESVSKRLREEALKIVTPFYSVFNAGVDPTTALTGAVLPGWRNCGNNDVDACLDIPTVVSTFINPLASAVVPGSITFQFMDIIVAGDTITVRGELSAVPLSVNAAPFFFCNPARARFTVMTQDIHTIKHGKIAHTYHIESFATALGQIAAANPGCRFPLAVAQVNLLSNPGSDARFNVTGLPINTVFNITGNITFTQNDDRGMLITGVIHGLPPNTTRGWHIHQFGIDETKALTMDTHTMCLEAGLHFNPAGVNHGDLNLGHAGDLGNLQSDDFGNAHPHITALLATVDQIRGRTLVIHHDVDDLGKGNASTSLTVGNSGFRIACGNIHLLNPDFA